MWDQLSGLLEEPDVAVTAAVHAVPCSVRGDLATKCALLLNVGSLFDLRPRNGRSSRKKITYEKK